MGYQPVNRQTTADFLVAVTDPNGRTVRGDVDPQGVPRTASDFEKYFRESEAGRVRRLRVYWVDPNTGDRELIAGGGDVLPDESV
jgi:ATP-binding cassette subfamily G (WHITE) protein 2 (SNQ2)